MNASLSPSQKKRCMKEKKAAGFIDVSLVTPPSPACLVLPLSQPVRTCCKRRRKPELILRVRFPLVMKLLLVLLQVSGFTHACILECFNKGAVNNDVTVVSHCHVESCTISLLSYTKTEKRHKERKKYAKLLVCDDACSSRSSLTSCVLRDYLVKRTNDVHCGYLRRDINATSKPMGRRSLERKNTDSLSGC